MFKIVLSLFFIFTPIVVFAQGVVDLEVPFASQAPYGNWSEPWQNACEETVITMVDAYYSGFDLSPAVAKDGILKAFRLKESIHGKSLDENSDIIVDIINKFFHWESYVKRSPTLEDLIEELDAERPIIYLAHGSSLDNPNFRSAQLDYHTIVLSGYDMESREFITDEPGTQYGGNFRYSFETIMNAMHDFVPGDTANGPVLTIFTRPTPLNTGNIDGDGDGLNKLDEIKYGTVLWLQDSDGDGYSDGDEVRHGYNPTMNEHGLPEGSLLKSKNDPRVYYYTGSLKKHITSEESFLKRGYSWGSIITVSEAFLRSVNVGDKLD